MPPLDDPARLTAVRRLVAACDPAGLDRLTRLAALLLDAPYAQVSLLAQEQVVVSRYGRRLTAADRRSPAADSLCHVTVRGAAPLVVCDAAADDRVRALPPVVSGAVAAYLGVPLRDAAGTLLGALCVYAGGPRPWSPEQVGMLGELAESVVAELELRALGVEASSTAARLDLTLDASGIGSFDFETDTGALHWDDRLMALFGYDRGSFAPHLDSFTARVHPEDRERVGAAIEQAVATLGELSVEYRIVRPGGEVRWVEARGRVLPARGFGAGRRGCSEWPTTARSFGTPGTGSRASSRR